MKNWPPIPFFVSSLALIVVGVLSTLNLTCPICGGTGFLKAAQGLTVKSTNIRLINQTPVYQFGECGVPLKMEKFTYAVDMTLTNISQNESKGTVDVQFSREGVGVEWVQDAEGNLVEQQYNPPTVPAFVDVAGGATKEFHFTMTYVDTPLTPGEANPTPVIQAGQDMQDPTCGGTGTLSFTNWIAAKIKPPTF